MRSPSSSTLSAELDRTITAICVSRTMPHQLAYPTVPQLCQSIEVASCTNRVNSHVGTSQLNVERRAQEA